MLVGYNTNVRYKGNVFHVQTEDNGLRNPVIVTLLYFKGTILSSKRTSYAQLAADPDYKEKVRELMKEQHKSMMKDLIAGKFTESVSCDTTAPKDEPKQDVQEAKEVQQEPAQKSQIAKSLDDILLDFILKREE